MRDSCKKTLEELGLKYIDVLLVHWPMAWRYTGKMGHMHVPRLSRTVLGTITCSILNEARPFCLLLYVGPNWENGGGVPHKDCIIEQELIPLHVTWQAMESLVTEGLVHSIGVSNYTAILLQDLLSYAKIKPVCNQVEITPHLPQKGLVDYCQSKGIQVVAYGSLGRPGQHNLEVNLMEDPTVTDIAKELSNGRSESVTPAQVLLAWALQRGIAVIPKSSTQERIKSNLKAQFITLLPRHIERMKSLDINLRYSNPALYGQVTFQPRGPVLYE